MAKVSIIISDYKNEKYLKDCLESILNQTFKDWEIIVIAKDLNNSVSKTIKEYKGKFLSKIKFEKLDKNKNPSVAKNEGIKLAKGEFICFCDGDDMFHPERIEKMVKYLENNPEKVLVATNYWEIDEKEGKIKGLGFEFSPFEEVSQNAFFIVLENQSYYNKPLFQFFMVRRFLFEKEIFDPELNIDEDKEFVLRIAYRYPKGLGFINEPLYYRRIYSKNEIYKLSNYIFLVPLYRKIIKIFPWNLPLGGLNREKYISIRKKIFKAYANILMRGGNYREAIEFYKEILPYETFTFRLIIRVFINFPFLGRIILTIRHLFITKYKWKIGKIKQAFHLVNFNFPKKVAPSIKDKLFYIIATFLLFLSSNPRYRKKIEEFAYRLKCASFNKKERIYERNGLFYAIPNDNIYFIWLTFFIYHTNLMSQYEEPPVIVEKGDIVIDCGASIGDTSLLFAKKSGINGKVIGIEPEEKNYQLLKRVSELNKNKIAPIIPVKAAVYKEDCVLELGISSLLGSHALSLYYDDWKIPLLREKVKAFKIDTLVKLLDLERVDFIKMDIEGAEIDALSGAEETIKKFKPKLAICVYHRPNDEFEIREILLKFNPNYKFKVVERGVKDFWTWDETEKEFKLITTSGEKILFVWDNNFLK